MTTLTDKLGHEVHVGDPVVVATLEGSKPVIRNGVVAELDTALGLIIVEGADVQPRALWANEAIRLERDPHEPVEQFLPVGTTFDATYASAFGTYSFTVMADGGIRDTEGDLVTMEDIVLSTITDVRRPVVAA